MSKETHGQDGSSGTASRPGLVRSIVHHLADDRSALPVEGRLPSFAGATRWLNSEPLTPEGLRGRVVLVDFWTYTCVNWLRTLPYVRAWAAKYADAGLTVVGVHTPEFGFERNVDNVIGQLRNLGVEYPVAARSAICWAYSSRGPGNRSTSAA
jgi:thiol-disulfide isomerase/thioredoxin